MVKRFLSLLLVFVFMLSFGTAMAGPNLNPGKWEITTETEMVGMSMSVPPVTHTQCITKEDLVPQSDEANKECEVTDVKIDGDTVSWKIICAGQNGQMEGTGRITYSGDTMEGTMDMVIKGAGMKVKNKIIGKRIGKCD